MIYQALLLIINIYILLISALVGLKILIESIRRFQTITALGISYCSFFLSLVLKFASDPHYFPILNDLKIIQYLELFFLGLGFSLLWIHQDLSRHAKMPQATIIFITTSLVGMVTIISFRVLFPEINEHGLIIMNFLTVMVALSSLTVVIALSVREFKILKTKYLSVIEIVGHFAWTVGISSEILFLHLLIDEIVWSLVAAIGISLILLLYLKDEVYLHKITRNIFYFFLYHDSGVNLFHVPLHHRYLINEIQEHQSFLVGGVFSAIDSIFRKLLQQEIVRGIYLGKSYSMYFCRDARKKLAVVLLADEVPIYLQQTIRRFLTVLPSEVEALNQGKVVETKTMRKLILPHFQKMFPYLVASI